MISNQILQNTIDGLKSITRTELCVCDIEGKVLATTFAEADTYGLQVSTFASSLADSQAIGGFQFFKIFDEHQLEYVLMVEGTTDDTYMVGRMASFQVENLLIAYKERFDKDNFIKNLLLDNLLLVDIYNRAKKLHIETTVRRVVYIIETKNERDVSSLEAVKALFASRNKDFVTAVDERDIILVKEMKEGSAYEDLDRVARSVIDELNSIGILNVTVAYGTIVNEIKEVSKSYKENIVAYSRLGIGRLIYQLPIPLCKMFIKEIFDGKNPEDLDEETLTTINKFFENSLNVSETSRQLFIHRNTLVYRLDKLQKSTGLDLRMFEDAITFKIALMVVKYMSYMDKLGY